MEQRKLYGVRIVSPDRIRNMSDGSLRLYHKRVRWLRIQVHPFCDLCMGPCRSEKPRLEGEHTAEVRTVDWLWHEVNREIRRRRGR